MCLFHDFSEEVVKGSRVPPQSLKKTPKWTPKGAQMESRGVKVQPQGYKKCRKSATCSPRVPKRSPGCYNGAPRSPQMQNTHKKLTQIAKKTYQKVPQGGKQRRKTIYPQTTNQKCTVFSVLGGTLRLNLLILGLPVGPLGIHFSVFLRLWGRTLDPFCDFSQKLRKRYKKGQKKAAGMDAFSLEF